jgi:hypothetical protein
MKILGFLCLTLLFSTGAWAQRTLRARTTSSAAVVADFFPLQVGNSWTYALTGFAAQGSVTVKVTNAIDVEGVRYYKIEDYTADPVFVRQDAEGRVFELRTEPAEIERWFTRANSHGSLWYDLAAPVGTSWESGLSLDCVGMAVMARPPSNVEVPARVFEELAAVSFPANNCADAGVEEEIFAAGVGLVRRTSLTIGGPRSMVLVSAQVNGKQVGAKGLAVSLMIDRPVYFANLQPPVDPVLSVPVLHAQFKLENTGEQPLTISIPSGQEFDLVIRDEAGEEVFRWSDGKFFTQALQTISLSPGERVYTVDVPLGKGGQPLPPGRYTVEAWIATVAPKLYQATLAFELQHVF